MNQTITLLFGLFLAVIQVPAQSTGFSSSDAANDLPGARTCHAHEKHIEMMGLQKYADAQQRIEQHTQTWAPVVAQQRAASQNAIITIPVVFHVVYASSAENISDAQIQSQLDVLNDDFRRLNADADNTWPQAADTEIEFCLASFDPQGNPSNGILRVPTTVSGFGTNDAVKSSSSGGSDAWPAGDYLNFWVCNIGGGILGYAQFPGGSDATDGVVCGYQYTGTIGTATSPFDLGRTATHEVGHWLNLRHIWGDGACGASDFVDDTPDSDGPNYGCATGNVACSTVDMVENYMDYSDDACMNLFTQGQTDRMLALFQPGGSRESLLSSNGCAPPCEIDCGCTDATACNYDASAVNDDGTCDFSCYGCTDAAACNYDGSATIDDGSCVAGGPQTFTMSLTTDTYGAETSWTLTDASGATVMSGSGYANSTNYTASEQLCYGCYTLTVNDSYGDGMCCTYGNGGYSLTVNGEEVASGGTFSSSDVTNFCAEPSDIPGCTTASACNYNPSATVDDGSCATLDACDVCGGPGAIFECGCTDIPVGDCDCNGNQADAIGDCGGSCTADADSDGICDDVDPCVGTVDACGICNGPGAIYECGCTDIPAGDCDCNGGQVDAIGVCGGDCTGDADQDGICDDVDTCVGTLDECGVCNGPGIPAGDCDCLGNQLDAIDVCGGTCAADADGDGICDDVDDCVGQVDALGVCNGSCAADEDEDGICDDVDDCVGQVDALGVCNGNCPADVDEDGICDNAEVPGCQDGAACNFDPAATDDDGSCIFLGDACDDGNALTLGDVYTNCALANFGCQGVGPEVIYEETFQDLGADYGWTGNTNTAINETEWSIQVGGATDWFKTVSSNGDLIFEGRDTDFDCVWTTREIDVSGFTELEVSAAFSEVGALENADFVRIEYILDGQTTVIQTLSNDFGTNNIDQISIPDGNTVQLRVVLATNANNERIAFDDVYLFGVPNCVDSDGDGICNENDLCSDLTACNFSDTQATGCLFDDACGVCGGPGEVFECGCNDIPAGDCDCDGNQLDALNVCGGTCAADADADGICDDVDPCVGQLDICGVCNGPGAVLECGCSDIPAGDCDCNGNQADAIGECGGTCTADADSDGICDDVDTCIGTVDACGICNGPGAIYACGCSEIPAGDCDCDGNQADAIGVCGGSCTADADSDGICDDVDPCVGTVDACGVCEGPGAIFECGCNDIPAGDCDCDGNQLDALNVCGGTCAADADADGICDDVDPCVGQLDICGVCNGPGAVLECGCSDIPAGDCDCNGNQADAIGECGGTCTADADSDGICDDVDTCIGTVDACGICNGPGAIYACGCSEIPAGDCDCDGNQADAIGVCGGSCTADADSDGICDIVDPCVGTVDACGVCEGPGDIFECGCNDIPAGDCDCDGNQLDAAGVCGGDCTSDVDGDGVCDTDEVPGCDDALAVNYNPLATDNDGSCTYLPASFDGLVAEAYALNSVAPGTHTFRVYAQFSNPNDQLVSVYGNAASPLSIESSTSFYQNILGDATADNLNPLLFGTDPLLEWDSFVAIGAADNSSTGIQSAGLDFGVFEAGGALTSDPTLGGSWFVFPDQEPQAFPDADGRVLIGQFTTDGTVTLQCNIQYRASDGTNPQVAGLTLVFPNSCPEDINGDGLVAVDDILILLSAFGCTGTGCTGDIDMDGVVGVSDILDVLGAFSTSCF